MTAGQRWTAWALTLFYAVAGALHIARPEPFVRIVPDFVPWPEHVVLATGLAEIVGAAALQSAPLRRAAGLGLALYALAVWPANFKHAFDGIVLPGLPDTWWYHGPRLAAQPLFVLAALYAGGWLDRRRT